MMPQSPLSLRCWPGPHSRPCQAAEGWQRTWQGLPCRACDLRRISRGAGMRAEQLGSKLAQRTSQECTWAEPSQQLAAGSLHAHRCSPVRLCGSGMKHTFLYLECEWCHLFEVVHLCECMLQHLLVYNTHPALSNATAAACN